jgi:hypothetical protein
MGKAMEGRRRRATAGAAAGLGAGARRYGLDSSLGHEQSGPAQVNKPVNRISFSPSLGFLVQRNLIGLLRDLLEFSKDFFALY